MGAREFYVPPTEGGGGILFLVRIPSTSASASALLRFRTLLAHLSQRLIGELIGYPWSGVGRPSSSSSSVRPSTISNVFSSETAWPITAKFYVEPPWEGGTKVYINGHGHMTKMSAMPIYGKNLKKSSTLEPEVL